MALEILYAWEAVDVFCLAVFAANLEISQFAAFIVGDSCDGINKILEQDKFDMLLGGDDKCFDLVANLKSSAWLIFTSAFTLVGISSFYLSVFHSCLHDKHEILSKMKRRTIKRNSEALAVAAAAAAALSSDRDSGADAMYSPLLEENFGEHDSWRISAAAIETEVECSVQGVTGSKDGPKSELDSFSRLSHGCWRRLQVMFCKFCMNMHLVRLVRLTNDDIRRSEMEIDSSNRSTSFSNRSTIVATVRNILPNK